MIHVNLDHLHSNYHNQFWQLQHHKHIIFNSESNTLDYTCTTEFSLYPVSIERVSSADKVWCVASHVGLVGDRQILAALCWIKGHTLTAASAEEVTPAALLLCWSLSLPSL